MANVDIEPMKARLAERRAELLADDDATRSDRAPVELDQQSVGRLSRMDALQVQAMAEAQAARRRAELRRIDQALHRIAAGEYGVCIACGEEIAPKRLDWDPAVATCVRCARGDRA
jgi:RNA polymerase-binding transcription factor